MVCVMLPTHMRQNNERGMMKRILWVAPALSVIGLLGLFVWIQSSQPVLQSPAVTIDLATVGSTPTNEPPLAVATLAATAEPTLVVATPTLTVVPTLVNLTPLPPTLSGVIVNANGPVAGAIVQIHGQPKQIITAKDGTFILNGISGTTPVVITAWSSGHYVGSVTVNPSAPDWKGGHEIKITLKSYEAPDNTAYPWFSFEGVKGTASCGLCHREYKEWLKDAHSQSATNIRFLSFYTGQSVNGNPGQPVQYGSNGKLQPPDSSQPYYGAGYRLDNPNRAGNCATCHTPLASRSPNDKNCGWLGCHSGLTIQRANGVIAAAAYSAPLQGVALDGIACDFCHKIGDVILDPKTRLPRADMPGILSMRLYRPQEGQQIFFGTLVDVPRRVSYLPLLDQSEFCAPCHYGVFGGVVETGFVTNGTTIYNSYGEWLNSPYSNSKTGKTCQQCHMPRSSANWYVFPERGGLQRDYVALHNHTMPGATDEQLLQNSVTLKVTASRQGDQVLAEVGLANDQTGHDVPTDSPLRSMILVVEALDKDGKSLALLSGPVNPDYSGNYGGQPGKTYAKVLKDELTGETPSGAYWRSVTIVSDNRLAAFAKDTTHYNFSAPVGQAVTIKVHLIYRRIFQALAQQKGFTDPDIVMEEATLSVQAP
jgi:hypothetical protein